MNGWMEELQKEENNKEFSELVHNYYKLATMRVMQEMRSKYNVSPDDIPTLMVAIFARMLNESVYSVGANLSEHYGIDKMYTKEHLTNLLKVLTGEVLSQFDRTDIDIFNLLEKFKEFIVLRGDGFRL
jgi:hypothetical protein